LYRIHDLQEITIRSRINEENVWMNGYMEKKISESRTARCSISIPEWTLMKPMVERNPNYSRFQEFLIFRTTDIEIYLDDIITYKNEDYVVMTIEERNKTFSKYLNFKTIYAGKVERNV
jgi:hypothetical protein